MSVAVKWSSAFLGLVAGVLLIAPVLVQIAGASTPFTVLGPGHQVETSSASVQALGVSPADGRLRGEDFTATVDKVAWPQRVAGSSGVEFVAGTDSRLVAFTLSVTQPSEDAGILGGSTRVSASLEVGANQMPISMATIDQQIEGGTTGAALTTGTDSFTASVPAHQHNVALVLTEGSFSQSLNLWTLRRVPPAPSVLYSDPRSASVAGSPSGTMQLNFMNPDDGFTGTDRVDVASTALTWFAPDGSGTTPADPHSAFLVVNLQSVANEPNSGDFIGGFNPLAADLLTFTPSGGAPLTASTAPLTTSSGEANGDDGLFDALYWFAVPATTTAGTLSVAAGPITGTEYNGFVGIDVGPMTITAPAGLTLSFPAPAPTAHQNKPTWVNAPLPATGIGAVGAGGASANAGHGEGSPFPIWLAVLLLVLVAAAVVVAQRRFSHRGLAQPLATPPPVPVMVPTAVSDVPMDVPVAAPLTDHQDLPAPTPPVSTADPMLKVLGPVEFDSYRQVPDRRVIEELLCWLVLNNVHSHNADEIQLALRPTEGSRPEVSRKTFHSYLSGLRTCIGAEHLPDATNAGGYRINGIDCDWFIFEHLCDEADATTGIQSIQLRTEALELVRGVPFQGVPRGQYAWVFSEQLYIDMANAVITCALRLTGDLMALGRYKAAEDAARAGLRGAPQDDDLKRARDLAIEARNEGLVQGRTIDEDLPVDPDDEGSRGTGGPGDPN